MFFPTLSWGNIESTYFCENVKATIDGKAVDAMFGNRKYIFNHSKGTVKQFYGFPNPDKFSFEHNFSTKNNGQVLSISRESSSGLQERNFFLNENPIRKTWMWFDPVTIVEFHCKLESSKDNNDLINQCLDLGFKKGTEGLKNCVLELS